MIAELSHYALVLALGLAVVQAAVPLWGASRNDTTLMGVAEPVVFVQFFFVAGAFAGLTALSHPLPQGERVSEQVATHDR